MSFEGFSCKQCGSCCTNIPGAFSHTLDKKDVERWAYHERDDILEWVVSMNYGNDYVVYECWFDPETGEEVDHCPWLSKSNNGKYVCTINDVKPNYCRDWPHNRDDAESTGCKGFDPK